MRKKLIFLIFSLCFVIKTIYAGHIKLENTILSNSITSFPSASITVVDDRYADLPLSSTATYRNALVTNQVLLYIDHKYTVPVSNNYNYTVKLEIKKYDKNTTVQTEIKYLHLQYNHQANPGNSYADKVAYTFQGAHKLEVKILEIKNASGTTITNPEDNFILKSSIDIERYDKLNRTSVTCLNHTLNDGNSDGKDDQLTVYWNPIPGAESYDLEWTWIDNYGNDLNTPKNPSQIHWNFRSNASRINTKNNDYSINLIFEQGYLLFRVRAIGAIIDHPEYEIQGNWSVSDTGTNPTNLTCNTTYYLVEPHQEKLNWQYNCVYAEEGKKKEVITYFDGSLRDRQSLTKTNSNNIILAAETIYDFNGRKAISILPVPLSTQALSYAANLNLNSAGNKYSWKDFDIDKSSCESNTDSLKYTHGAGNYYSHANISKTGNKAYIPESFGFPFTQTEYTPDNTGRIRAQGGVGKFHQLGYQPTGYEKRGTKYFYGQPTQIELDRLFGSEVGYAQHYKKNMIEDPNGQISISYLDQEGHVIATNLASRTPSNVSELSNKPATNDTIIADLIGRERMSNFSVDYNSAHSNMVNFEKESLTVNTYFLASEAGNHTIDYGIQPIQYTPDCDSAFCFDCIYDLTISITDDCGNYLSGMPKTVRIGHPVLDTTCGEIYFSDSLNPITYNLAVGTYHISKVLTVNKDAYVYYLNKMLTDSNNSCLPTITELLTAEKAKLNYAGCDLTCEQCAESLGTIDEFVLSGKGSEIDWKIAYNECWRPCKSISPCEMGFNMMLGDMAPGGQYAEYRDDSTQAFSTAFFPLSIFNPNNQLPDGGLDLSNPTSAFWRHPMFERLDTSVSNIFKYGYYEKDGKTRSKIELLILPGGTTFPEANNTFVLNGKTYCFPENLKNLRDFIQLWRFSWARSLIYFHPEYCYYKWCNQNLDHEIYPSAVDVSSPTYANSSVDFDFLLHQTKSFYEATNLFGNLKSNTVLVDKDPFFLDPNHSALKSKMENKIVQYMMAAGIVFSIQDQASIMVHCPTFYGQNITTMPVCNNFGDTLQSTIDQLNDEWTNLKALYLSFKYEIIAGSADEYAFDPNSCNRGFAGCIGVDKFNPFATIMNTNISRFQTPNAQMCSYNTAELFKLKVRRFDFGGTQLLNKKDSVNNEYNQFYYSGKCPLISDFDKFLNELVKTNRFDSTDYLHKNYWFTPKVYEHFLGTNVFPLNYNNLKWVVNKNDSSVLKISIIDDIGDTIFCGFEFKYDHGFVGKIDSFHSIRNQRYDTLKNMYVFDITAIASGLNYKISVYSCKEFSGCSFADDCRNTDYANSIEKLLSAIATQNDLLSTSEINLETNYKYVTNRFIRNNIGGTSNNLRYKYVLNNNFKISQYGTSSSTDDIIIRLKSIVPSSIPFSLLDKIVYFNNFKFSNNQLDSEFTIEAYYSTTRVAPFDKFIIKGTVSRGRLGICTDPVRLDCQSREYDVTSDFESFLANIIQTHPTTETNLLNNQYYSSLLESYIGSGATKLTSPVYSNNSLTASIHRYNNAGDTLLNSCTLKLYRLNTDAYKSNGSFANLIDIGSIGSDYYTTNYFSNNNFTVLGRFANGATEELFGYISCIPIADCPDCIKPPAAGGGTGENCYDMYYQQMINLGLSAHIVPFSDSFPCDCVENYLYYVRLQRLGAHFQMVGSACYSPLDANIVYDIEEYASRFSCKITYCTECQLTYQNQGSKTRYFRETGSATANLLLGVIDEYNNHFNAMSVKPSWYSTLSVSPDSIEELDCECAAKYAVYINRWSNFLNTEYPAPDTLPFKPLSFTAFKNNGCRQNDCWWEYQYYVQKSLEDSATLSQIAPYSSLFDCSIWIRFANTYLNLTAQNSNTVAQYASSNSNNVFNGPQIENYSENSPLPKRIKTLHSAESLPRDPNLCPFPSININAPIDPCTEELDNIALHNAKNRLDQIKIEFTTNFRESYYAHCLKAAETFTLKYPIKEFHYTLYYYDQAGSLVRTVPPAGVKLIKDTTELKLVSIGRSQNIQNVYTNHILNSVYEYNSLNQLIRQSIPDHDKMDLWKVKSNFGIPEGFKSADVYFENSSNGIMIGAYHGKSMILKTTDGGNHWERQIDIYTNNIQKVAMVSDTLGYAIGNNGLLLKTIDGAANWKIIPIGEISTQNFIDIIVRDSAGIAQGIIAGNNGFFKQFSDNLGVFTWSVSKMPSTLSSYSVKNMSFKETATGLGYALVKYGSNSKLLKCTAWSTAFSEINLPAKTRMGDVKCVDMISNTHGFAAGNDGLLIKTTDGGASWKLVETGVTHNFERLYFQHNNPKYAAALANGVIYQSSDTGHSWSLATATSYYRDFHFYDQTNNIGFAIGNKGDIAKIQWVSNKFKVTKLNTYQTTNANFNAVYFHDSDNGIALADDQSIFIFKSASKKLFTLKLTNITGVPASTTFTDVYLNSSNYGAATANGELYEFTISGTGASTSINFTQISSGSSNHFTQITNQGSNIYVLNAVNNPQILSCNAASISSNSTYSITPLAGDRVLNTCNALPNGNILALGNSGTIRRYTGTWNSNFINTNLNELQTVSAVPSTSEIWLAGNDGNIYLSTDDADTFKLKATGISSNLYFAHFSSIGNGIVASNKNEFISIYSGNLTARSTSTKNTINGVFSHSPTEFIFLTQNYLTPILFTQNNGVTFSYYFGGQTPALGSIFNSIVKTNNGKFITLGANGVAYSKASTSNWTRSYITSDTMNDLHLKNGIGMMVGNHGMTFRTINYGNSWFYNGQIATSGSTYTKLNKVYIYSNNLALILGNHNSAGIFAKKCNIDATSVNNLTFASPPSASTDFNSLIFNELNYGAIVGNGSIYRLTPTASSWVEVDNQSGVKYRDVDVQYQYLLAVGDNKKIRRSENFQTTTPTFTNISNTASNNIQFSKIVMYDRTRAYIVGDSGYIFKTNNKGLNWYKKFSETNHSNTTTPLYAVASIDRENVIIAGNSGYSRILNDQADFASSLYWYDRLGRMVVSQNTKQFNKTPNTYSYTKYDPLNRITEVGEKKSVSPVDTTYSGIQMNDSLYNLWVSNGANNTRTEVTRTFYDNQQAPINVLAQTNLKKRVSSVYYQDTFANLDTGAHTNYMHATHYAYDVHGNVNTLIQDVPELNSVNNQYKKINYFYDLVSNKVNLIIFDKGKNDEYQHRYTYDADNRVTQMETSRDGINWDNDASYEYYDHGPLARTELGDNKVQGLDYVYTIQGWIKGVNSNTMNETRDPGRDGDIGLTSNEHAYIAKDAFGYSLSYFEGDYQSIQSFSTTDFFMAKTTGSNLVNARNDLWNGNIGSMVTCLPQASTYSSSKTITPEAFGNAYKYDQLNRIAQSRVFTNISYSQNEWLSSGAANPQAFGTNYTYDPMGNILSQKRNGAGTTGSPLDLDNLIYGYNTNSDGLISNRLYQVRDSVSATNYTDDIDNQDTLNKSIAVLETANNYGYDELGNLKHDKQEQIARIDWTVYGKIKRIVRTSGSSKPNLVFGYDASGNRLWKKVITPGTADSIKTFYYVRDAQGNEMCHYIKYKDSANRIMFVSEEHSLYGSSRVGVDSRRDTLYMAGNYHPAWMDSGKFYRALGLKNYELSNHLGNVLVTVSDKPIHKEISGNIYFEAEITTINDYYPFGSSLNTRSFSAGSAFRFGFNGKEKQSEFSGDDYDFGARIYDGRLGRWFSVEPLYSKYPDWTTYQFAFNSPNLYIDKDGYDNIVYLVVLNTGTSQIKNLNTSNIKKLTESYLSRMGLTNINVVIISDPAKIKKLNISMLDPTDVVAVLGDLNESKAYIQDKDKIGWKDIQDNGISKDPHSPNIEKAQLPCNSTITSENKNPGNRWVWLNSTAIGDPQFQLNKLPITNYISFLILHSIGHSSNLRHSGETGVCINNKCAIMDEGDKVNKAFFFVNNSKEAETKLETQYIFPKGEYNNNSYIQNMKLRFNSKVAKDNVSKKLN